MQKLICRLHPSFINGVLFGSMADLLVWVDPSMGSVGGMLAWVVY